MKLFHNTKIQVKIEGMSCNHCAKKVESSLLELDNIKKVKVNLTKKIAIIYSNSKLDDNLLKEKIESLGYQVQEIKEI